MERVTGIGGVFLRARDPEALRAWYEANLGIPVADWGGHSFQAEAGDGTVWAIFPGDTGYWPLEQQEFGRFGWAVDPEGNRLELWQPAAKS